MMLNIKQALGADILEGIVAAQKMGDLPKLEVEESEIGVKRSQDNVHGDYASPVALVLTKKMKKPPLEIVEAIAKHMPKKEYIGKLEAASPGFLNIRLHDGWLLDRLDDIVQEENMCASANVGEGKLVNLEFISANPTGPLTLGNVRTAFSADTLANVLSCTGYNVTREYYVNDAGEQVRKLGESVLRRILQDGGIKVEYPDDLYQGDYIRDIGKKIAEEYQETEGKAFEERDLENDDVKEVVSKKAMNECLTMIKKSIKDDLRITMDVWSSEKQLRKSGEVEKTLERLRKKKETYKKDDAEFLKTTAYGDTEDRVLVKKNGEYTYFTPDIAYHQNKFDRKFDLIFTFLGADHQGHIARMVAAMKALGNDTKKLHFVAAQWLRLVRGGKAVRLSKRRGNIFAPKDLIDEVGHDAARFFMVSHNLTTHMDFDLDLAKERSERNPVYYVQYAFVRLQSILRKAKEQELLEEKSDTPPANTSPAISMYERALLLQLFRWPEVVAEIATSWEVHQLAYYARDIAKAIHIFYRNTPVLGVSGELLTTRLLIVQAAKSVLASTLDLLGISKPDVM